jgi:hypothetical protein
LLRESFFVTILLLSTSSGLLASSRQSSHSGQFCEGALESDRAAISRDPFALRNSSSVQITIYCPNHWNEQSRKVRARTIEATVYYFDRSPTNSVSCRFQVTDNPEGFVVAASDEMHSCATPGGCSQLDPSFVSETVTPGRIDLKAREDDARTASPLAWTILCTLPARRAGEGGSSGIAGYSFRWQSAEP